MEKMSFASVKIAVVCTLIFVIQIYYPSLTDRFALSRDSFQPLTLITYMFLHGSLQHIFYNMFALVMFGIVLESIVGTRKFLIIYFLTGIASGMVGMIFYNSIIGASGAIFGIIGCLTVLRPKMTVLAFGVPMPIVMASALWMFIDIIGVIYPDHIAHMGHISGFIFGSLIGMYLRSKYPEPRRRMYSIDEDVIEHWEDEWF